VLCASDAKARPFLAKHTDVWELRIFSNRRFREQLLCFFSTTLIEFKTQGFGFVRDQKAIILLTSSREPIALSLLCIPGCGCETTKSVHTSNGASVNTSPVNSQDGAAVEGGKWSPQIREYSSQFRECQAQVTVARSSRSSQEGICLM
jgi:hypothetical protein